MCVRAHTCVRVCALALARSRKHYNVRKQLLEAILYSLYVGPRGQIEVAGPTQLAFLSVEPPHQPSFSPSNEPSQQPFFFTCHIYYIF